MKRSKLLCACLALCLTLSLFSACVTPVERPSESENTIATMPPAEAAADSDPDTPEIEFANTVFYEEFPSLASIPLSEFKTDQTQHAKNKEQYTIRYTFMLCGMRTDEDYKIVLIKGEDGYTIQEASGNQTGNYTRFYGICTNEMMEKAKAEISAQAASGTDAPYYYLEIDKGGALIMRSEQIVQLSPGDPNYGKGCGDHEHRFYSAEICK